MDDFIKEGLGHTNIITAENCFSKFYDEIFMSNVGFFGSLNENKDF